MQTAIYFLTTRIYFISFSQATVTTKNFLWIITALSREFPYLLLVLGMGVAGCFQRVFRQGRGSRAAPRPMKSESNFQLPGAKYGYEIVKGTACTGIFL